MSSDDVATHISVYFTPSVLLERAWNRARVSLALVAVEDVNSRHLWSFCPFARLEIFTRSNESRFDTQLFMVSLFIWFGAMAMMAHYINLAN